MSDCACGEVPMSSEDREFGPGICAFCAALKYRDALEDLKARAEGLYPIPNEAIYEVVSKALRLATDNPPAPVLQPGTPDQG